MSRFPFIQVDAFTDRALGGNACAVVFDTDELDHDTMLAIAREQNLSETAFVRASDKADFGVRYFTPAEEIPLAGHPTIATSFALVDAGRVKLSGDVTTISLELSVGPIQVDIHARDGRAAKMVMTQKKPEFFKKISTADAARTFGVAEADILDGVPLQVVSTGTPQLMVPLRSLAALRGSRLDFGAYDELRARAGFFSAHLFCLQGMTPKAQTFARHYAIPPDLIEDPFTGSATGGMGAYLWRYGLIDSPKFMAEQGHDMHRPGVASVEVVGPRDEIETVRVGGSAVAVLRGAMVL